MDDFLAIHMGALPDSLSARKKALVTLLLLLPHSYSRRHDVAESLRALHLHEAAQARFQFSQGKGNQ